MHMCISHDYINYLSPTSVCELLKNTVTFCLFLLWHSSQFEIMLCMCVLVLPILIYFFLYNISTTKESILTIPLTSVSPAPCSNRGQWILGEWMWKNLESWLRWSTGKSGRYSKVGAIKIRSVVITYWMQFYARCDSNHFMYIISLNLFNSPAN